MSTDELFPRRDRDDRHNGHSQETRTAIQRLQEKIARTKEAIKIEQTARDENVNEYLKLASNADKTQLGRIKSVFEKKNQKSAQTISHQQKKLESYQKKIKDIEQFGYSALHQHRPKEMLRDMGQKAKGVGSNIVEGISTVTGGVTAVGSGVISGLKAATHATGDAVLKPFSRRFGSADNLAPADKSSESQPEQNQSTDGGESTTEAGNSRFYHHHPRSHLGQSHSTSHSNKHTSDDEESSSITSDSGGKHVDGLAYAGATSLGNSSASPAKHLLNASVGAGGSAGSGTTPTLGVSNLTDILQSNAAPLIDIEPLLIELRSRREEVSRLTDEVEQLKTQLTNECQAFHDRLQDERFRFERLEEQMNDATELHQHEIENLKQGIADMEEKVQYQSEERLRDVHEMLESCQTRISRMEHQQHQHLQQLVNLDSLENSNARALVLKLINVLLTILQVILLLVATIASMLNPILQSRTRMLLTIIVVVLAVVFFQQWTDMLTYAKTRLIDRFPAVATIFKPSTTGDIG